MFGMEITILGEGADFHLLYREFKQVLCKDARMFLCVWYLVLSIRNIVTHRLHVWLKGYIDTVEIVMNNKDGCEKHPHMDMDEHCECGTWHNNNKLL